MANGDIAAEVGLNRIKQVRHDAQVSADALEKEPFDKCEVKALKPFLLSYSALGLLIIDLLPSLIQAQAVKTPKSLREFLYQLGMRSPMAIVGIFAVYVAGKYFGVI